jgi:hypothetical protein
LQPGLDIEHVNDENLRTRGGPIVWNACVTEGRTLITMNGRDFVRLAQPGHPGIVWVRSTGRPSKTVQLRVMSVFLSTQGQQDLTDKICEVNVVL